MSDDGGGEPDREVERIRAVYAKWEGTLDKTNAGYQTGLRQRNDVLHRLLHSFPLSRCRVLDVGCGFGDLLAWFESQGLPVEGLYGVDLLSYRIKAAREAHPAFTLIEGNATQLEFPDASFDLVTVFTVFSSILDDGMARQLAQKIDRLLADDGAVVWYDIRYPNPWNRNVKSMPKERIHVLFPEFRLYLEPITLIPQVARHLGPLTTRLYAPLSRVPLLCSHYLGLLRRIRTATVLDCPGSRSDALPARRSG